MIPFRPIRSVLAATELSAATEEFLGIVHNFAKGAGAELHVVSSLASASRVGIGAPSWLETQKELHERRLLLRDVVASTIAGAAASARVWLGNPADVILEAAAECAADLIVLGPHRQRALGDRYLGSTAERVLESAEVPCLILNGPLRWPIARILVPADFSTLSNRALRTGVTWVRMLSRRGPVEIDCVHVAQLPGGREDIVAATEDGIRSELEGVVRGIREEAGVKIPIEVHVLSGREPLDELLRFATERSTDLVVMGTSGDSVFLRALLGSLTSGMLRRTTLPLLLVPPRAFAAEPDPRPEVRMPITADPIVY